MRSATTSGRRLRSLALIVALAVGGPACGSTSEAPPRAEPASRAPVTRDQAVDIAERAIAGKVEIQPTSVLVVDVRADVIVVEWRTQLEPHTRGPDYDARVTVDRWTGEAVEIQVGS